MTDGPETAGRTPDEIEAIEADVRALLARLAATDGAREPISSDKFAGPIAETVLADPDDSGSPKDRE